MITINRKNLEPLVFEEATTVDEAVEYAVNNHISLEGADLSDTDLSGADLKCACFRNTDLSGADLTGADVSDTDLREANLSAAILLGADLTGADVSYADLSGAAIDYSCWPLWSGSLDMKIDKRIFCQLLYHVIRAGKSVDDEEVRKIINNPENIAMANKFHHASEYGKILQEKSEGR